MKEVHKELQMHKIQKGKMFSKALKLGKGAYGQVFLGFDQEGKTPFACKLISLEKINSYNNCEVLIKKIKDEIINMQIAKNDKIVQFYHAKMSQNNIYILCEYCNGDNLQSFLKNRGFLTETEAMNIFKDILQGFYNLRQRNIVHRDIKPANILMHNYSIKIADLGFSKSIENHSQLLESVVGSPLYMSPQIFQRTKYTQKTDIWSLGVILYELLYGVNPFAGCSNLLELKQRIKRQINFPDYPIISENTKDLIKRIMVVEEKDRISWQILFKKYLLCSTIEKQIIQPYRSNHYILNASLSDYFRKSYFIESHTHLHKIIKDINLLTEEQIYDSSPIYNTYLQFFSEVIFKKQNNSHIIDYYACYIEKRNEIAYIIVLCDKLNRIIGKFNNVELDLYLYSIQLLAFKYSKAVIEELLNDNSLKLIKSQYKDIYNKLFYDKLLVLLLQNDRKIICEEYKIFYSKYFEDILLNLPKTNASLFAIIQNDLSAIYSNEQGDQRVIRFFFINYLKKVFNALKEIVGKDKPNNTKISEMEQQTFEQKHKHPPLQFTIIRMINEYLTNEDLFNLKIQQGNRNLKTLSLSSFKKNLNQFLFDFENTMSQHYYNELAGCPPHQQQSIVSFISKSIRWNAVFTPQLI